MSHAILPRTCKRCERNFMIRVPEVGFRRWQQGELIQNAMPCLSDNDRELLISSICESCFDEIFEQEDEKE